MKAQKASLPPSSDSLRDGLKRGREWLDRNRESLTSIIFLASALRHGASDRQILSSTGVSFPAPLQLEAVFFTLYQHFCLSLIFTYRKGKKWRIISVRKPCTKVIYLGLQISLKCFANFPHIKVKATGYPPHDARDNEIQLTNILRLSRQQTKTEPQKPR